MKKLPALFLTVAPAVIFCASIQAQVIRKEVVEAVGFNTKSAPDQGQVEVIAANVTEAATNISASGFAGAPKFVPGMTKELFTLSATGDGGSINVSSITFDDPNLSWADSSLSIDLGTTESVLVTVDQATAARGIIQSTATITSDDPDNPVQTIDVKLRVFETNTVPLIDFDDGVSNGIHEYSIRNGGFEEGSNGQSVDDTPEWRSKAQAGTSTVQLTYNADPATGSLHGQTASWRNPGTLSIAVQDFLPDDWTFEEGDTFSVKFRWKPGAGFDLSSDTLNCVMHARYENGTLIHPVADRPIQVASTTDQTTEYTTTSIATAPVPAGSIWLGLGFRFMLECGDSSDNTYAFIDDVSVIGHFKTGDDYPLANPIEATIPETSFLVRLEEVVQLPDSSTGTNRFARVEQISPAIDGSDKVYASDQRGKLYSFVPGDLSPTLYFDFGPSIPNFRPNHGQSGIRGFAFHPDAFTPGAPGYQKMYTAHDVETSNPGESHKSVVSEWTLDNDFNVIAGSRRDILEQSQPRGDHNIGKIGFNPNLNPGDADYGNLYITFADGGNYRSEQIGGSDTTLNPNSQDTTNYLGCMLRIDPLENGADPYSIPADNPFIGQLGFRPEIWAYGLRNPHQFSWDTGGNGDLLIADIGQSNSEEINIGRAGANYGWLYREGTFDVTGNIPDDPNIGTVLPADHATDRFTYPVLQFDHDFDNQGQDTAAIVGGNVYRGSQVPKLEGFYVFGNFGTFGSRGETLDVQDVFIVDVSTLQERDDFTNFTNIENGFLAPIQRLRIVDENDQPIRLLDLVREKTGNSDQNRADMRIGSGPDGEIYVTSKKAGMIWTIVPVSDLFELLYPDLPVDGSGDHNVNGISDFAEYAAGFDPKASGTPVIAATLSTEANVYTYSHPFRSGAEDVFVDYEFATTLSPADWSPLLSETHYTIDDSDPDMPVLILDPTLTDTNSKLFLRHSFTSEAP